MAACHTVAARAEGGCAWRDGPLSVVERRGIPIVGCVLLPLALLLSGPVSLAAWCAGMPLGAGTEGRSGRGGKRELLPPPMEKNIINQ